MIGRPQSHSVPRSHRRLRAFGALTALTTLSIVGPSFLNDLAAAVVPFKASKPLFRLKNWGISNVKGSSHIHAVEAWDLEKGNKDVIVAVIDTGIDPKHPDLKGNIWNEGDAAQPVFGWDYTVNRPNPTDEHGHGTHVAGIIGATVNPRAGIAGVAQKVSIMGVKYYKEGASGAVNLANTVKALNYAIDHGARIINYSGGGPEFSEQEYLAIKRAEQKGILIVAAAGNERQNADLRENFYYPAAYGLSNIICVAATDINNRLLASSNWGRQKVDVAAPGENIYSTLPGGRYGAMSGTSQATAFVSGLAALMLAKAPSLKPAELKELIRASVDPIPGLKEKVGSGGRVNAYMTLLNLINRGNKSGPLKNIFAISPSKKNPRSPAFLVTAPGFDD